MIRFIVHGSTDDCLRAVNRRARERTARRIWWLWAVTLVAAAVWRVLA